MQEQSKDSARKINKDRITPAYAGTMSSKYKLIRRWRDHTCVCRNNCIYLADLGTYPGSPLRMQEQSLRTVDKVQVVRITPAYAGTIFNSKSGFPNSKDHPCVCRNNCIYLADLGTYPGSPLRMQEQFSLHQTVKLELGITPAYAGTMSLPKALSFPDWDHPCVCRNNFLFYLNSSVVQGSPLRMQEQ